MEVRTSEFKVVRVRDMGNTRVVVYEAVEPAEIYTIPNWVSKEDKDVR